MTTGAAATVAPTEDADALADGRDRPRRYLILGLVGLALVAFLVRLVPVLIGGGLTGKLGFDDTVYFSAATAFVEGRLPYRDFNSLHPPGIFYLLSPFAALGGVTGESTAFATARVAFMVLGAVNTILVALVARRAGMLAAICAAVLYALWVVPAQWERTTYLVAPQGTLLLIALLLLTGRPRGELTARRVAVAGAAIGLAGAIQVWTVVPAAVVFGWLLVTFRGEPQRMLRLAGAYVAGGVATVLVLLLPFLVVTGPRMIQMFVFTQLGRTGEFHTGRAERLRLLEGVPVRSQLANLIPDAAVILVFLAVAALVVAVAWKRREIRLWVAILAAQTAFLMITPVFYPHYGGWIAPQAALALGATLATGIDLVGGRFGPTGRRLAIGIVAVGFLGLGLVSLRPDGEAVALSPSTPDLSGAPCVTADAPIALIRTETLRRSLENGCELLLNPNSLSHVFNASREGGKLPRRRLPEYQQAMADYYGSSDAVLILRPNKASLSAETWAAIKAQLPIERQVGPVTVLLRSEP